MSLNDQDLLSIQQARALAAGAHAAQRLMAAFSQEQVDRIVDAMAEAAAPRCRAAGPPRARGDALRQRQGQDRQEPASPRSTSTTTSGRCAPWASCARTRKTASSRSRSRWASWPRSSRPPTRPRPRSSRRSSPSRRATRCVMSPHPSARRCILETVRVMHGPAVRAGLPEDALVCMDEVSLEGTQELMRCRDTGVILATGGIGLVRAAYSSGKPAYGVGPGNVPAYIEKTADVPQAVRTSSTARPSTTARCARPSSRSSATRRSATRCSPRSSSTAAIPERAGSGGRRARGGDRPAPGQPRDRRQAGRLHRREGRHQGAAGHARARGPPPGVGRDYPLSIEKLCPVLAFYVVKDWHEGVRALPPAAALRRHRPHAAASTAATTPSSASSRPRSRSSGSSPTPSPRWAPPATPPAWRRR